MPSEIKELSPKFIRMFLDAYRFGDGFERIIVRKELELKSRERQYFTSSVRMADDIGELILKVGNYPSFKLQKSKGKKFKHKNGIYVSNVDVWRISENTTRAALYSRTSGHGLKFKEIDYDGWVHDVQLAKNHVLWVRRNGKTCWSGNCLCHLIPVHEQPEEFVKRLKKWKDDPGSDKELENWYNSYGEKISKISGDRLDGKLPVVDIARAKTLEDCKRWAGAKYPDIVFEFDGADVDAIRPTLQQFDKLAGEWPDVTAKIELISTKRNFGREYAHATWDGKYIGLNPAYYGNYNKMLNRIRLDVMVKFHPRGCDSIESIMTHEFGHMVNLWLEEHHSTPFMPIVSADGTGLVGSTLYNWIDYWFSKKKRLLKNLSKYTVENKREAFAEAFAAHYHQKGRKGSFLRSFEVLLGEIDKKKWLSDHKWLDEVKGEERAVAVQQINDLKERLGLL